MSDEPETVDDRGRRETTGGLSRRSVLGSTAGLLATTVGGVGTATAQSTAEPRDLVGRSWEPQWTTEFDGTTIDEDVWTFRTGGGCGPDGTKGRCNWGNNEAQYYTDGDNAFLEDGRLVIEAREEQVSGPQATYDYTSSRMVTAGAVSTQYGRIDARAKMPIGQGLWPAIWMLPEGNWTWPDDGEIDIVEYLGHQPSTIHGTVHGSGFSGADGINASYQLVDGNFHDSFHDFSLIWDPDRIQWFVDGERFHEVTRQEVQAAGNEWPFDDRPFHLVLNVAVGGSWPGYPDETTEFPQRMEVESLRIFAEGEPSGPAPLDGTRPTDPDADGEYEDLTGNGEVDNQDVVAYFQHMGEDGYLANDRQYFDYSGNQDIDYQDLIQLFGEI